MNKLTYLLLFIGTVAQMSCSKLLEETDPSRLSPDNFYTIPEHAESAIAAVYASSRFIGQSSGFFANNFQLVEAVTGTSTTESAQEADLNNLYSLVYDGTNITVVQWWNGLYKVIAQANLVIQKVPGITPMNEAQKQLIIGEAKFFRAWAYFYAVRLWGDVPLITLPQTVDSEDYFPSRVSQEEVYNFIVEDLIAAENAGLPWKSSAGRITQAAVKAQLSKVYLTMAGFPLSKGLPYYQLAADKANEVITYSASNPGDINLFPAYADLHSATNNNKLEHLFQIQYLADVETNPMQLNLLPYSKPMSGYQAGRGTQVPTISFFNSFDANDLRAKNQQGFFFTTYYANGNGDEFDLGAPYIFKHFDVVGHGSPGVAGTARSNLNMMQIRFAEVLLIFAEAQNEISGPTPAAYDALKRIRDRAELTTPDLSGLTQSTFREIVLRERWYELCYEGITWFDMVRLRQVFNETTLGFDNFVGHINQSSNQPLQEKHLLFPLPVPEMINNPNLTPQNPGYPN